MTILNRTHECITGNSNVILNSSNWDTIRRCGKCLNIQWFTNYKEWNTDTCYNIDKIDKHETNKRIQSQKTKYWMIADTGHEILKVASEDTWWTILYILKFLITIFKKFLVTFCWYFQNMHSQFSPATSHFAAYHFLGCFLSLFPWPGL